MSQLLSGFAKFIKQYNIAGMAVAFVVGLKVNALVQSLVADILMPAIFQPVMARAGVGHISELQTAHGIMYGQFLVTLIDFLVVVFIAYVLITYLVNKFFPQEEKK